MKKLALGLLLLTLCAFETPMMYSRSNLPVILAQPKEGVNARLLFDAEIRDAASVVRTPGWFNFATLGDANAAMVVYAIPAAIDITRSNDFAPVDVLMLNNYGDIVQILPSLIPAQLEEIISSPEPVAALLYLKGGASERFGITPGDKVEYALFKKRPTVLTKPGKEAIITPAAPLNAAPVTPVKITPQGTAPAASTPEDYLDLLDPRMNTQIKPKRK